MTGTNDRERRLAEALRANLRRRKAQARATDEGPPRAPAADGETPAADPVTVDPITEAR